MDELELLDQQSLIRAEILESFIPEVVREHESLMGGAISDEEVVTLSLQKAMLDMLRLQDQDSLSEHSFFEKSSCKKWKTLLLSGYYERYFENYNLSNLQQRVQEKVESTYFVVLDLNLPLIRLNLLSKLRDVKSESIQTTIFTNQCLSVGALRKQIESIYLEKLMAQQKHSNLNNTDDIQIKSSIRE